MTTAAERDTDVIIMSSSSLSFHAVNEPSGHHSCIYTYARQGKREGRTVKNGDPICPHKKMRSEGNESKACASKARATNRKNEKKKLTEQFFD